MNHSQANSQAFQRAAQGMAQAFASVLGTLREPISQMASQLSTHMPNPPPWLVDEAQQRVVLLLNHVLQQEPEALNRLRRHAGQRIRLAWRQWTVQLAITPAGLLELERANDAAEIMASPADLTVRIAQESPWDVAQTVMKGEKPEVRIEGDVQLAAQVNWLTQYVRWDVEEDLSRVIGDAPAHWLASLAKQVAGAIRSFALPKASSDAADATTSANNAVASPAPPFNPLHPTSQGSS